jgi:thiamine biosynthesis lipoprotein
VSGLASSPPSRLRRARPLLGTLVDIRVEAGAAARAQEAIAAAFAEIAIVHRLMSFHEAGSDLARLNRARPGEHVCVDARTAEVLQCAESLRLESTGAFDCAVADSLVGRGRLPSMPATDASDVEARGPAGSAQVVVRRGAARLDLGGIAKGYAVDRAIGVLLGFGIEWALVNAGGDLRHIGTEAAEIKLRDPADPSRLVATVSVRDMALASSASNGLSPTADAGDERGSTLIDPRCGRPLAAAVGASVIAPRCMMADALTKVVLVTGDTRHAMLEAHGASVVLYRCASPTPA